MHGVQVYKLIGLDSKHDVIMAKVLALGDFRNAFECFTDQFSISSPSGFYGGFHINYHTHIHSIFLVTILYIL